MLSDYSLDLNSETMISFLEMENVQEVETVEKKQVFKEQVTRPSVIMKPMKEMKKEAKVPNLADILTSCGIEYDLVDSPEPCPVQSPSSIHSDMELEKTQELIDELEEFFMKTDGTPTVVDEEVTDTNITMEELNNAVTTNMMTEDGQNVVIVIAPSSPTESLVSISKEPTFSRIHSRFRSGMEPISCICVKPTRTNETKKERKKAQNRTAAFRYREKMKKQEDSVEEELEA